MSQVEQRIPTSESPSTANDASRSTSTPLIAVFVAAAVVIAGSWFSYEQGRRDAAGDVTQAAPSQTQDAMTPPSDAVAQQSGANDSTTIAASSDDTVQPSALSEVPTSTATQAAAANTSTIATPAPSAAKAKPAAKRSVAHSTRMSRSVAAEPQNRAVALLDRPEPTYPPSALREHQQGTVVVLAQVDVQGHVSDTRVIQRSGSFALDRAAANEVRKWQFQPALENGKPVVASAEVPVTYRLDQ